MVESRDFVIIVDSRESKLPYMFSNTLILRKQLKTGDYSVQGFEDKISVERKTVADLYSSLSTTRNNFMLEMERLQYFESKALVIEGTYDQIINPARSSYVRKFSKLERNSVLGTLAKIAVEYGVNVIFAGSRRNGEEWTHRILRMYFEKKRLGLI